MITLALLLLGGWVALDGAAVGQFLVSRPLVASSMAGLLVGAPLEGVVVGLLLELAHVAHVPLGGIQLPEPGPGAVVAGSVAGLLEGGGGNGMTLALAFVLGLALSWLAGWTVTWHRHVTSARLARLARLARDPRTGGARLGGVLAVTLIQDGLRGMLIVGLGLGILHGMPFTVGLGALAGAWPLSFGLTALVLAVAALTGVGEVARIAEPVRARRVVLFLSGVGAGVVLALSFGVTALLVGAG
jgi:hypothetical protein